MKRFSLLITALFLFTFLGCKNSNHQEEWWTEKDRQFILQELDRTTSELMTEIQDLSEGQALFREDSLRWNILEVVEHLEMQNQLHYRELTIIVNNPQLLEYRKVTEGNDKFFSQYSTSAKKGKASWFLTPKGKYCTLKDAQEAFATTRLYLRRFVEETRIDLRKQFAFHEPVEGKSMDEITPRKVLDLHQLLLLGIAHTDRHLHQIQNIKKHSEYPK